MQVTEPHNVLEMLPAMRETPVSKVDACALTCYDLRFMGTSLLMSSRGQQAGYGQMPGFR